MSQLQFNVGISPTVKKLIIANVAIWFGLQVILERFAGLPISHYFALRPNDVLFDFQIWQLGSYMFLHTYQVSHIVFNMLMLWFIGTELEQRWGPKFFLSYYIVTGVGAAVIYCLGTWIYFLFKPGTMSMVVPVMGASGAIFGLLLAYGILFGERVISFMMLFPMKAKYFVMILGAIELSSLLTSDVNGGDVAYLAHIGGLISGFLTLKIWASLKRNQWGKKPKKKGGGKLRLVVDNEEESQKTPKYWN